MNIFKIGWNTFAVSTPNRTLKWHLNNLSQLSTGVISPVDNFYDTANVVGYYLGDGEFNITDATNWKEIKYHSDINTGNRVPTNQPIWVYLTQAPGDIYLADNAVGIESVKFQDGIFLGNLDVEKVLSVRQKIAIGKEQNETPNITIDISASDAIQLPFGNTSNRPTTLKRGQIRYNTEIDQFEGYGSGNQWNPLIGITDVDLDTKITAEDTPGDDQDELKFFTAGTEKMIIKNTGKIGINKTNPRVVLDINSNDAIHIPKGSTTDRPIGVNLSKGMIRFNTTLDKFEGYGENNKWTPLVGINDDDNDTNIKTESASGTANTLTFYTLGNERMTITSSGNIGIGTITPGYKLHVNGGDIRSDSGFDAGASSSFRGISNTGVFSNNGTANINDTLTLSKTSETGLSVTSNATIGGTLDVTSNTTIGGSTTLSSTLAVTGATTITGALDANSTADIAGQLTLSKTTGTGLSVASNATIGGTLDVTSNTTIGGTTTLSNTLNVGGATTLTGALDANSSADIAGQLTLSKTTGTGLSVASNATIGGTLGVGGATTLSSTLGVTGTTTLAGALDANSTADIAGQLTLSKTTGTGLSVASNATIGGTLAVTGTTTITGAIDANSTADIANTLTLSKPTGIGLNVTSNTTIGGTLDVTGSTNMTGSLDLNSTADIADTLTLSKASGIGLDVTSNTTIGGALVVTGSTTMTGALDVNSSADIADTLTLSKASDTGLDVTSNATIRGTLVVTGSTTMTSALDVNSTADIANTLTLSKSSGTGLNVNADATIGGKLNVGGVTTMNRVNISSPSDTSTYPLAVGGSILIDGDLVVTGNRTVLSTTNLDVKDSIVLLNQPTSGAVGNNDSGILIRNTGGDVFMGWDKSDSKFILGQVSSDISNATGDAASNAVGTNYSNLQINNLSVNKINAFELGGNITPDTSDIYDIGSSGRLIRNLFVSKIGSDLIMNGDISGSDASFNNLELLNNATIAGNSEIAGTLIVSGTTTLGSDLSGVDASFNNLELLSNATIAGTLEVSGATAFGADISGSDASFNNLELLSNATIAGNSEITGTLVVSGATTLGADISGADASFNNLEILSNATIAGNSEIAGTLEVSGATTLGADISGADASFNNLELLSNATIAGNSEIAGTLIVSGATTLEADISGVDASFNNLELISNATIGGNTTNAGTLEVSGATTFRADISGADASFNNLELLSNATIAGNSEIAGTLEVSGATTLGADISGADASFNNLELLSNATIGGTLAVTGAVDLNSTADIANTLTLSEPTGIGLNVISNATIGGTLDVTSNSTIGGTLDVTSNSTIGGTLAVTGVTTITSALDVNSTADIAGTLTLSKSSGTGLNVNADATIGGKLILQGGSDDYIESNASDSLILDSKATAGKIKFNTNGSTRVTITENGNVGIGLVPNSSYKLDVNGDINVPAGGKIRIGGTAINTSATGFFSSVTGGGGVTGADVFMNSQSGATYGFVGIGTNAPSNQLTINGSSTDSVPILGLQGGTTASNFSNGSQIAFGYNGNAQFQHFIHTRHNGAANSNNAIDFYVCDGTQNNNVTSGSIHTMSLVSGNVGIGTTEPNAGLDIEVANNNSILKIGQSSTEKFGLKVKTGAIHTLVFSSDYSSPYNTDDILTLTTRGSVGIGTSSPNAATKLEVIQDTAPSSLTTLKTSAMFRTKGFDNYDKYTNIGTYKNLPAIWGAGSSTSYNLVINPPGAPGKVGIGTEPTDKLHVFGDIYVQGNIYSDFGGSTRAPLTTPAAAATTVWSAPAGGNVYRSTGNVGIGTSNPNAKLHVKDGRIRVEGHNGDKSGVLELKNYNTTSATTNYIFTEGNSGSGFGQLGDLVFQTASTSNNFIFDRGNVGIGTNSPNAKLEISGHVSHNNVKNSLIMNTIGGKSFIRIGRMGALSDESFSITKNLHRNPGYTRDDDDTGFQWLNFEPNGDFGIITGPPATGTTSVPTRLIVKNDGKVGIGRTIPSCNLEVYDMNSAVLNKEILRIYSASTTSGFNESKIKIEKGTDYGGYVSGFLEQGVGSGLKFTTNNGTNEEKGITIKQQPNHKTSKVSIANDQSAVSHLDVDPELQFHLLLIVESQPDRGDGLGYNFNNTPYLNILTHNVSRTSAVELFPNWPYIPGRGFAIWTISNLTYDPASTTSGWSTPTLNLLSAPPGPPRPTGSTPTSYDTYNYTADATSFFNDLSSSFNSSSINFFYITMRDEASNNFSLSTTQKDWLRTRGFTKLLRMVNPTPGSYNYYGRIPYCAIVINPNFTDYLTGTAQHIVLEDIAPANTNIGDSPGDSGGAMVEYYLTHENMSSIGPGCIADKHNSGNVAQFTTPAITSLRHTSARSMGKDIAGNFGRGLKNSTSLSILAPGENQEAKLYFGTQHLAFKNLAKKAAIIVQGRNNYGKSNMHFCLNNNGDNSSWNNARLDRDEIMTLTPDGYVGIGINNPGIQLHVETTDTNTTTWNCMAAVGNSTNAKFVMGSFRNKVVIGGHDGILGAWRDLYINPYGGYTTGIGTGDRTLLSGHALQVGNTADEFSVGYNGVVFVRNSLEVKLINWYQTFDSGNLNICARGGNVGIGLGTDRTAIAKLEIKENLPLSSATTNPVDSQLILTSGGHRSYIGSYYTAGSGTALAISSSDFYSSEDHPQNILLNPNGGNVGIGMTPSHKLDVSGNIRVGAGGGGENAIFFKGNTGDLDDNMCVIENRIYDSTGLGERSELLLFKGNDYGGGSGPDRIRLKAAEILLDTYNTTTSNRDTTSTRLKIDLNGNVGINKSPGHRLDVNGNIACGKLQLAYDNEISCSFSGDNTLYLNYSSGNINLANHGGSIFCGGTISTAGYNVRGNGWIYWSNHGNRGWYMQDSTWIRTLSNASIYAGSGTIATTGRIGVGTSGPGYPVEVIGQVGTPNVDFAYYALGSTVNYGVVRSGGADVSIKCTNRVMASEFAATSDQRIKENIVEVPDNISLQILRDISCCYYNYRDRITKGNEKTIGFIAQQVREQMPMAVSLVKEIIPNEMRIIENPVWTSITDGSGNNKFKLAITDLEDVSGNTKYKFYMSNTESNEDEKMINCYSLENEPNSFIFDEKYKHVFLYGKEIDDFHFLEKSKLFALNFSATQEIDRIQQAEKIKLKEAENKIATAENKVTAIENKYNVLKAKNDLLETKNEALEDKVNLLELKLNDMLLRISSLEASR